VHCSLLGDAAFGETGSGVVLPVVLLLLLVVEYRSGTFSFLSFFFSFLIVCICANIRMLRCCRGY
jgi:hypothetical protein